MINNYTKIKRVGSLLVTTLLLTYPAQAQDNVSNGAEVYEGTCIACHGENGKGEIPGVADFTSKEGSLNKADDVLFDHVLNGFQSDNSDLEMPALGGNEELSDQDIRDVIAYLRATFQKTK
tara:strand:+ start:355 stop:717 length:363 start_codon:yes stop_codon:yes gene_type:complete